MNKNRSFTIIFSIAAYLLFVVGLRYVVADVATTTAPTAQDIERQQLEQQIQDRSSKLEEVNKQLEETKKNLQSTQSQKNTLQNQVNTLTSNIKNLELNIKSDLLTGQKLALEVQNLELDIADIKSSMGTKKDGIESALRNLQKSGNGNLLLTLLGSGSLSESVFKTQSLKDVQKQLSVDIAQLRDLQTRYEDTLNQITDKKDKITQHKKDLENRKDIVEDQKVAQQQILKATKNQESLYQKQLTELQKQQQAIAAEIENLDAALRAKIDPNGLPTVGHGVLALPLTGSRGLITQDYGATAFAKYGYRGQWHNGVDLGAPVGTPIMAADGGTVVATGDQDKYCYRGAYGKFVVITHNNGLTTLYGHMSKIAISKGETVVRGQVIGYVGATGYATGPHLHFTVFSTPTFSMGGSKTCGPMPHGGDLNPLNYL